MNLNSLVLGTLSDVGAPVQYMNYTGSAPTYLRFFEYDQRPGVEADNLEQAIVHHIQIDIFSPGNYLQITRKVKKAMEAAGFKKNFETETYEEDTKLFHKVLRFYFVSTQEEEE